MLFSPQIIVGGRRGASGGGGGGGAEASAFLARTSGLDGTHTTAYTDLINGLVSDGVWSKLDVLHVYATQDSTTALLNLVSTNYNGTAVSSPTFTADRGFTGGGSSYINTNFNPTTATSPQFVQNSAHLSAWSVTNTGTVSIPIAGANLNSGAWAALIHARYVDNNTYYYANVSTANAISVANASVGGHYIANRSGASAMQGYKNGSSVVTGTPASVAPSNLSMISLGQNTDAGINSCALQVAMTSIGSSLSGTDASNLYTRLRTYMTAVGVP